jgi:hypothetical protein
VSALLASGYVYELIGLIYFVFYLRTMRPGTGRYSRRTRALTLVATIALVGSGMFGYAGTQIGVAVMLLLVVASIASTYADRPPPVK